VREDGSPIILREFGVFADAPQRPLERADTVAALGTYPD